MNTAPPTLVFGVTGLDAVAQAIVALGLRFASEPDAPIAPPIAHASMPLGSYEEDEDNEEDADDPWDDTDLDDEDDAEDAPPPSNVRQAQPSVFAQMVGGAVAGRRVRGQERSRPSAPRMTPATPTPPTVATPSTSALDTGNRLGDVLGRLQTGEALAAIPRMLHARMDAALQGAATLAPIVPPPTGAALRLDTTGGMALFLTLGQGALDSETETRLHAYLRAVFPEWAGSGILAVDP